MCGCEALLKAIDRYIEKAGDDLEDTLAAAGFAASKKTVKAARQLEDEVADALIEETELFTGSAAQAVDLEDFAERIWPGVKLTDGLAAKLTTVFAERFDEMMPDLVKAYLYRTDKELKLTQISKVTTGWIKRWSADLGDLMKLDSHKEIEHILDKGLKNGDDIAAFTRAILDSGIRDEYYRARRVSLTEVLRAHSVAQQEAFRQNPSVTKKLWRHTGDYRNEPRQNHADFDGTTVETEERFELPGADGETYYPMYPRDTILPAGESINCHCLCEPVVDADILGLPLEERQALQQKAIDEMDEEWEKELDAQNKAKAGIEV